MKYLVEIDVEIKQEHGAPNNNLPALELVAAYVQDYLRDAVRPEYDINWMPRSVRGISVNN